MYHSFFTPSSRICYATATPIPESSMQPKQNLTINPQRLWDQIMETAKYGATPKGGIRRLTVSDEDKKVRDWFKVQCEKLGCAVKIDSCGNMFATRPGKR